MPELEIVCLHGLGRSPADWDGLRPGLRAISAGVSTPVLPRERAAALTVAKQVLAGTGPAILIGHSMGAVLALMLAAQGDVRALVLTNSFFPPARNDRTRRATAADYLAHRVAFLRTARAGRAPSTGLGTLAGLALHPGAWRALISAVPVPVLVVHTPDDHHVPIDFARAAAAGAGWSMRELAYGGHHAHMTRPADWLGVVGLWLTTRLR